MKRGPITPQARTMHGGPAGTSVKIAALRTKVKPRCAFARKTPIFDAHFARAVKPPRQMSGFPMPVAGWGPLGFGRAPHFPRPP